MRPPKNKWPDTEGSRGILFFAQLMSEMLNTATFESFRALSLCTVARLDECYTEVDDVRRERLNKLALEPILAELIWSLDNDPVAKNIVEQEIEIVRSLTKSSQYTLDELSSHILLLSKKIGRKYKTELEKLLIAKFNDAGHRLEFRRAAGFYCSHLMTLGYSRPHITNIIDAEFFQNEMRRTGVPLLRRFFKRFNSKRKKFTVYAAVSSFFGAFLRSLGSSVLPFNKVAQSAAAAINPNNDPDLVDVVVVKQTAFDEYGAMLRIQQLLTNVRALTYLAPQGMPCKWSSEMYVIRTGEYSGSVQEKLELSFDKTNPRARSTARQYRGVKSYSQRIFQHFDRGSVARLLGSITTSALARTTSNVANQLISLWSAIEILLSDPKAGTPRIVHYSRLIVPCICLRHVRRQFGAVCDELLISYKRRFKEIVAQQSAIQTQDFHTRFASLMLMPNHEPQRRELLKLCTSNPLALHRLFKLNKDFGTSKNVAFAISSHESRVEWQVHRIYRARNNVVHAGRMPTYLDSLMMNLIEYYRSAIGTIVNTARQQEHPSDVDQIVAEVGIEYQI